MRPNSFAPLGFEKPSTMEDLIAALNAPITEGERQRKALIKIRAKRVVIACANAIIRDRSYYWLTDDAAFRCLLNLAEGIK